MFKVSTQMDQQIQAYKMVINRGSNISLLTAWLSTFIWIAMVSNHIYASDDNLELYRGLIKRQPFLPQSKGGQVVAKDSGSASNYRFTGFVTMGNSVRVGIENVSRSKSYLLKPGQTEDGLSVKDINVKEKYIMLVVGEETLRLNLADVSPASSGPSHPIPSPDGKFPDMRYPDGRPSGMDSPDMPRDIPRRIQIPGRDSEDMPRRFRVPKQDS